MLSTYSPNPGFFYCLLQNYVLISENIQSVCVYWRCRCNTHARKEAVKLMHMLPSHVRLPLRLTVPGMLWVSISSSRRNTPSLLRNPTTILGTPSRKDWAHILRSFRSNFTLFLSSSISSDVLSSTQFIGCSLSSGLQSHTLRLSACV